MTQSHETEHNAHFSFLDMLMSSVKDISVETMAVFETTSLFSHSFPPI